MAWREECTRVESAYRHWHAARGAERELAFAACLAALDGEDHAAAVYGALVERTAKAATGQPSLTGASDLEEALRRPTGRRGMRPTAY